MQSLLQLVKDDKVDVLAYEIPITDVYKRQPTATPAEAKRAINELVSIPMMPTTETTKMNISVIFNKLNRNVASEGSMLRR